MNKYCYTTLLASDDYLYGVLGLYYSLLEVDSKYPLHIVVTDNISQDSLNILKQLDIPYNIFPRIDFLHEEALYQITFNKFHIFGLKEYDKVCFIDADAIVNKNIDLIFSHPTPAFVKFNEDFISGVLILIDPNTKELADFLPFRESCGEDESVWNKLYLKHLQYNLDPYFSSITHHSDAGFTHCKYWKVYELDTVDKIRIFIHSEKQKEYFHIYNLHQKNEDLFGVKAPI
jgi:hypothetical protein